MIRKWDSENGAVNKKCIDEIVSRIQDIDDTSQVGVIAAQDIIDIVTENLGPEIYNKAIADMKKAVQIKLEDLGNDMDMLKQ